MRRFSGKKPSAATVISIVALVFAVAGTSVASIAAVSVLSKKEKKQTRKIAKKQTKKLAPRLSVDHANTAGSASPTGGAGGDLTGAYPGPALANGSVGSAKVENRSLRATDYSVFNGTRDIDLSPIAAETCTESSISLPGLRETDVPIIPTPVAVPDGVTVTPITGSEGSLRWHNCNVTAGALDPPLTTFSYIVLRP